MKSNILFVDDEEKILRTMKLIFGKLHNVFTATNGPDAIKIVQSNDIKVVVCDQRMPQMLGVEVLQKIKELSPTTMRILLTGYSDVHDLVDSVNKAEIFRYIMKPWQNQYLKKIVDMAINAAVGTENVPTVSKNEEAEHSDLSDKITTNLLVIDNDINYYKQISTFFRNKSSVFHATTLSEALEILEKNPDINFIISELFIDNRQATDILTTIKSQAPNVVIMVLTAHRDSELLFKLINEGQIFRFLLKPINKKMFSISLVRGYQKFREINSNTRLLARYQVDQSKDKPQQEDQSKDEAKSEISLIKRALSIFSLRKRKR